MSSPSANSRDGAFSYFARFNKARTQAQAKGKVTLQFLPRNLYLALHIISNEFLWGDGTTFCLIIFFNSSTIYTNTSTISFQVFGLCLDKAQSADIPASNDFLGCVINKHR